MLKCSIPLGSILSVGLLQRIALILFSRHRIGLDDSCLVLADPGSAREQPRAWDWIRDWIRRTSPAIIEDRSKDWRFRAESITESFVATALKVSHIRW